MCNTGHGCNSIFTGYGYTEDTEDSRGDSFCNSVRFSEVMTLRSLPSEQLGQGVSRFRVHKRKKSSYCGAPHRATSAVVYPGVGSGGRAVTEVNSECDLHFGRNISLVYAYCR